jgi:hypothetical protein
MIPAEKAKPDNHSECQNAIYQGLCPKTRSTNVEIRNKSEIRNPQTKKPHWLVPTLFFRASNLFRISCFEFRIFGQCLYQEVGLARSLLAFELPDGRLLKLIDGHLRRDLDPDMLVDVEVLDVTKEEARKLLLTIDPLGALSYQQEEIHKRLRQITPVTDAELRAMWQTEAEKLLDPVPPKTAPETAPEQFLILITCRDEKRQRERLTRFKAEGMECKALVA